MHHGLLSNNQLGVASPAFNAVVIAEKVTNAGLGSDAILAQGIIDAVYLGSTVINVSQAGNDTAALRSAIDFARDEGVIIVAAAGNYGSTDPTYHPPITGGVSFGAAYPAGYANYYSNVIAVGATDEDDRLAIWQQPNGSLCSGLEPGSNYGPWVTLFAPGSEIFGLQYDQKAGYDYHLPANIPHYPICSSGTSFATPLVTGTVSLMLAVNRTLTPAVIKTLLTCTGDTFGSAGYKRLNAGRAVFFASQGYSSCQGQAASLFDNLTEAPLSLDTTCIDDTNGHQSSVAPCLFYYQQFDTGVGYPLPASGVVTSITLNVGLVQISYQISADRSPVSLRIDGSSAGAHYSTSSNVTYAQLRANAQNGHWSTITFQFSSNDTVNLSVEKLAAVYSMYSNNGYGIDLTFQETATNPFPATNGVGNYCTIYGCGGLDNGHSIAFALNYKAPGKITAKATLDGKLWSGGLSFSLTGPTTYSAAQLPAATGSLVTGSYQISYLAGGPPGAILGGIAPCGSIGTMPICVVGLNSDVPLTVVFQFKTSAAAPIYDNLTNVTLSADTTCIDDTNGHQSVIAPCLFYSEVFDTSDKYPLPIVGVVSSITLNVGLVEASWNAAAANLPVGIRIDGAFNGAHYSTGSNVTYAQLRANAQSGRWTSITFQFSPSDTVDLSSDKLEAIYSMYSNNGAGIDLTFQETADDSILPSTNGNWVASYCSFFGCGTPDSAHDLAFAIR